MRHRRSALALGTFLVLAVFGCEADIGKQLATNADYRYRVMTAITADPTLAGEMIDSLLTSPATQTLAIDHLMANPGAVQDVMGLMAQDRTRVEGILNLAVQDAEMRDHLMTLLKGMELGRAGSTPASPTSP